MTVELLIQIALPTGKTKAVAIPVDIQTMPVGDVDVDVEDIFQETLLLLLLPLLLSPRACLHNKQTLPLVQLARLLSLTTEEQREGVLL